MWECYASRFDIQNISIVPIRFNIEMNYSVWNDLDKSRTSEMLFQGTWCIFTESYKSPGV